MNKPIAICTLCLATSLTFTSSFAHATLQPNPIVVVQPSEPDEPDDPDECDLIDIDLGDNGKGACDKDDPECEVQTSPPPWC